MNRLLIIGCLLWGSPNLSLAMDQTSPAEMGGQADQAPAQVLQNRFFLKALRPEIGVLFGSLLNEAYTSTSTRGVRTALFFNEWVGAEVQYIRTAVSDSADRKALNQLKYRDLEDDKVVSPDPEVNPIYGVQDLNIIWAPFYGKLNLLNRYIVYSDLYVTSGIARVDTLQGDINAFSFGLGQRFYVLKSISFRIDWRDHVYTEKRAGSKSRKNAQSIDFGFSYFFL